MATIDVPTVVLAALVLVAGVSTWDLTQTERETLVIYTTPALRDVLEKDVLPRFEAATGTKVALVYVPAGQQYNRLRLSGEHPEADILLHASPLYLEKGYDDDHIVAFQLENDAAFPEGFRSRDVGGRIWYAFAWSPLVEVRASTASGSHDLAKLDVPFGFPHPLLSNNGAYVVLLYQSVSPAAGRLALEHTRVQPTNARANIGGVADGSFALTLGYEAVVRFYQDQGANVTYELPLLDGERVTTPVLLSAALVKGERHPQTDDLLRFLFANETQANLHRFHFRGVFEPHIPADLVDVDASGARVVTYDWSRWADLEDDLSRYVVTS